MRVADARALWKVPSFETVKKTVFFRSVPAPCVYEAISFTRYSCFAVHKVPLFARLARGETYFRTFYAGGRFELVFLLPDFGCFFNSKISFYVYFFIFLFQIFFNSNLKEFKKASNFPWRDIQPGRPRRTPCRPAESNFPSLRHFTISKARINAHKNCQRLVVLWPIQFSFISLTFWCKELTAHHLLYLNRKINKDQCFMGGRNAQFKIHFVLKKTFAHLGAYFRPGAWPQRVRMIFFPHHKLCWVPSKPHKKVSLTLAVEMPNIKFTLYKKKDFCPSGGLFSTWRMAKRARIIFSFRITNYVGFQGSHKKSFHHVGGRNTQYKIHFV